MNNTVRWILQVALAIACLAAIGCASFQPVPMDQVPFKERALTQSRGDLTVTTVALGAEESKQVFGVDVASRGIQPVWLEVENRGATPYWNFPSHTDPDYFSPAEVAYMKRLSWAPEDNNRMRALFESMDFPRIVPPGHTVSGFIHTRMDPGFKYINVFLAGFDGVERFHFIAEVPGIKADYQEVDFENLYPPEDFIDCDEQRLRAELEKLPCCVTNKQGEGQGDPLNLVFVADVEGLLTALVGSGWDVTEKMSSASLWRTTRSFLFGKRYRHSPVSALYAYGRPQDAAFQKARETVSERNHLRIWLTPLRFKGLPVWLGQISRDIGVKFSLASGFITTHVIDPDVDNDRFYLIQNLADARALTKLGYVAGVESAPPDEPRYNLGRDPYFTDGLRAVMQCTNLPVEFSNMAFFDWEWPPHTKPYSGTLADQGFRNELKDKEKNR
ncbi:MAG: LssY C-terminal domain-containing protein [Deltaproteobacteria bacterium]|nr:LssY C-terminal domain-containing protein [Deltaproteobacteria bacterium]